MEQRRFSDSAVAADPSLVDRRLPRPWQRGAAMAIDCAVLVVPTFVAAMGAALAVLAITDPGGLDAIFGLVRGRDAHAERAALRDLSPLLVRLDAPGLPGAVTAAVEEGDLDRAAELLGDVDFLFELRFRGNHRAPADDTVIVPVERMIPGAFRAAALFGVPALYFTVLGAGGRRTLGKRLLGLEVLRLDGRALTVFRALERFGGYFGIPGTLGVGLLDLWRDPNRRLAHDRAAETVVLVRSGRGSEA